MRRPFPVVLTIVVLTVVITVASACNANTTPTPIPTPIGPPTVTENYSGTLQIRGMNLHSFMVTTNSEVDVTLVSVTTVPVIADPNAVPPVVGVPAVPVTLPLTLTVGQPTLTTLGVQCSNLKSVVATPGPTPQLKGQALIGTLCVSISDPNAQLTSPVNYALTVAHG